MNLRNRALTLTLGMTVFLLNIAHGAETFSAVDEKSDNLPAWPDATESEEWDASDAHDDNALWEDEEQPSTPLKVADEKQKPLQPAVLSNVDVIKEINDLKAEVTKLKNEMPMGSQRTQTRRDGYYEIPLDRRAMLQNRLLVMDAILERHGRAYDYRTMSTTELLEILERLDNEQGTAMSTDE